MERALRIEKFRNIGFNETNKPYERLVLNHSLKKEELGGLVILLGENNSGKSNILDALNIILNKDFCDNDITEIYMEDKYRQPKLELFYRQDNDNKDLISYKKIYKKKDSNYKAIYLNHKNIINNLEELCNLRYIHRNYYTSDSIFYDVYQRYSESKINIIDVLNEVLNILKNCENKYPDKYNKLISNINNNNIYKECLNYIEYLEAPRHQYLFNIEGDEALYHKTYGYKPKPTVIYYIEEKIKNHQLQTTSSEIKNNKLFTNILNNIEVSLSTIDNTFEVFHKRQNRSVLSKLENDINEKLKSISDKFNTLYFSSNNPYRFEVKIESNGNIYLSLFRGEQPASLDSQSTGFRWFFNLFFNLLISNEIKDGDIIIMDEPATHLHIKGKRELRDFLKNFAEQNALTIVIATHFPSLIDLDHLDEIRIIKNSDSIAYIENSFVAVNPNDPDTLLSVREALTVENHNLVNPSKHIVFVEGITDYNYLVAFKKLLGNSDFYFLPINGIGKTDEDKTKTIQSLLKIRKDSILLVDGDKAGEKTNELSKHSDLKVLTLADVNSKFNEIESLFSKEDLKKSNLLDKNGKILKYNSTSVTFKNRIIRNREKIINKQGSFIKNDILSEETFNNFDSLFKKLEKEFN